MCRIGSILSPWQLLKPTLFVLSFLNPAGNIFDNEDKAAFPPVWNYKGNNLHKSVEGLLKKPNKHYLV